MQEEEGTLFKNVAFGGKLRLWKYPQETKCRPVWTTTIMPYNNTHYAVKKTVENKPFMDFGGNADLPRIKRAYASGIAGGLLA